MSESRQDQHLCTLPDHATRRPRPLLHLTMPSRALRSNRPLDFGPINSVKSLWPTAGPLQQTPGQCHERAAGMHELIDLTGRPGTNMPRSAEGVLPKMTTSLLWILCIPTLHFLTSNGHPPRPAATRLGTLQEYSHHGNSYQTAGTSRFNKSLSAVHNYINPRITLLKRTASFSHHQPHQLFSYNSHIFPRSRPSNLLSNSLSSPSLTLPSCVTLQPSSCRSRLSPCCSPSSSALSWLWGRHPTLSPTSSTTFLLRALQAFPQLRALFTPPTTSVWICRV